MTPEEAISKGKDRPESGPPEPPPQGKPKPKDDEKTLTTLHAERVMGFCTENRAKRFLAAVPMVQRAIVDSGIILPKYWLGASPEEQTRRLESPIEEGRKLWKRSPMNLKSCSRRYDDSRAQDEIFAASDTGFVPSDDRKRARLNVVSHLRGKIPYEKIPREKIERSARQKRGDYREPDYP